MLLFFIYNYISDVEICIFIYMSFENFYFNFLTSFFFFKEEKKEHPTDCFTLTSESS